MPYDKSKEVKRCPDCGVEKEFSEYYTRNGYLQTYCKPCHRIRNKDNKKKWRAKNPERAHAEGVRRLYGLDAERFQELLAEQNGACAICGEVPGRLEVDHDHGTGVVRGLLCGNCNKALGLMRDDTERLLSAVRYLEGSYVRK